MKILFRTEANHRQGMGDLWGCLALAEECGPSDEILFLLSDAEEAAPLLRVRGFRFQAVPSLSMEERALRAFRPEVILVNKLNNPLEYIRFLKGFGALVVTLEDAGEGAQGADLRFNVLYPRPGALTGLEHIALRKEFQGHGSRPREIRKEVQEILITQGGSDTHGFTPRILRALERAACPAHATVVVGPAFQNEQELQAAVAAERRPVTLSRGAGNMADLMGRADLAITAGGITLLELACVGTPSIVVCGERFEGETAARMEQAGFAVHLGFGGDLEETRLCEAVDTLAADLELRKRMSERGRELVDGQGARRVMDLIRERAAPVSGTGSRIK